ncbi:UDP-glucose dehydrogenase family protein [Lutispora thermophila]|uniref:UDP-glucose 6-dehydrogenase n=1 Tax=Lutispora thermophila DSM 19022 TaxID=1122184 RepID=A0A1M6CQ09_9FIRM|nr:UDP-glucose/GDP-mannose dehydrogenase family protein [Lutispora thermophila]SHI63117.1 UDPglucose 6-dehydrogenase [Lutispora thermophila DSM 19022]
MNISIIGTGYVGLVTGACLAKKGHNVICVDRVDNIVNSINSGRSPIFENHLEELLLEVVGCKLKATSDIKYAVENSEVSIIAVGTPFSEGKIDLEYVKEVAYDIGMILKEKEDYHVVCVKSTVVPTTTDTVVMRILEVASGKRLGDFGLVMNPEFLREGNAVEDFMNPDRIVIGAMDDKSFDVFSKIYKGYFDAPIVKTNPRTAEMVKYTSNALLATLISFSNEIAAISEEIEDIDAVEVLEGVHMDRRLSMNIEGRNIRPDIIKYLKPGRGFGGSCFPKDVKSLITFSEKLGYMPKILKSVIEVNESQAERIILKLKNEIGDIKDKTIAVLGLAFKEGTDDIRESQSIKLIRKLMEEDAVLKCYDPVAVENAKKELGEQKNLEFYNDYESALHNANAAVIMTDWDSILNINIDVFTKLMKNPVIIDGCRMFHEKNLRANDIKYAGIGWRRL